jgi:hypothetical protein
VGVSSEAGDRLVPALLEGVGIFAVAFLGSEALFAPGADGVPLASTLVPGIAAGVAAFAHRVRNPYAEAEAVGEDPAPLAGIHEFEPRPAPRAPAAPRREAA